jgi:DNA-binding CsgD family transcriptional regulator
MTKVLISAVEAAYDLAERSDERWMGQVLQTLRPSLDRGFGIGALINEPDRPPFLPLASTGLPEGWESAMGELMSGPNGHRLLVPKRPATSASENIGPKSIAMDATIAKNWHPMGIRDGIGIVGSDGTGYRITIFAPMAKVARLRSDLAVRYSQLAAHLSAGLRLRRALSSQPSPSAVLEPSGLVVHAEGAARDRSARDALRDSAKAIDRARGRLRRTDEAEAMQAWRALVAGEWSLVDRFDADGRRFIVVHKNAPTVADPRQLSKVERRVLALSAGGHSLKLIAYELGLSISTVNDHKKSALRKLGIRSRAELIRTFGPFSGKRR